MSLRRTPDIDISIRPSRLVLRHDGRDVGAEQAITADGEGLHDGLERACQLLELADARHRARVVVDNDFCWLDVIEGDFAAYDGRVIDLVARSALTEAVGDAAGAQSLRWHLQHDGRHLVVLAMPDALIEAARTALAQRRWTLANLESAFVHGWNRLNIRLNRPDAVVAWVQEGHATVARVKRGVITAISREFVARSVFELNMTVRRLLGRFGDDIDEDVLRVLVSDDNWPRDKLAEWTLEPAFQRATEVPA